MNCCQIFFQLLLCLVVLAPTLINGKECNFGGQCFHLLGYYDSALHMNYKQKTCEGDRCYAFRCLDKDDMVMHGAGCYEDFYNACKWVDPETKKLAKRKDKYEEERFILISCKDGEYDCASTTFNKDHTKLNFSPDRIFSKSRTPSKSDKNKECDYDKALKEYSKPKKDQVQCRRGGACRPAGRDVSSESPESIVACKACAAFMCSNDNKEILIGVGCLTDFEKVCTKVSNVVKKKLREKKQDNFYYEEGAAIVTCSSEDNCHLDAFEEYVGNKKDVNATFGKNFDINYVETCEYKLPQKKNAANGVGLSGILLLGLLFLHLW